MPLAPERGNLNTGVAARGGVESPEFQQAMPLTATAFSHLIRKRDR